MRGIDLGRLNGLGPLLGDLDHMGFVVADRDEAVGRWSALGVRDWALTGDRDVFDCLYRGRKGQIVVRAAFGRTNGTRIELLETVEGEYTAATDLARRGECLNHLGCVVPNVADVIERAAALGVGVDCVENDGDDPYYAYLDTLDSLGVYMEIYRAFG